MPAVGRVPSFGRTERIRGPVGSTACRNGYRARRSPGEEDDMS